jgi:hypothetical protein
MYRLNIEGIWLDWLHRRQTETANVEEALALQINCHPKSQRQSCCASHNGHIDLLAKQRLTKEDHTRVGITSDFDLLGLS